MLIRTSKKPDGTKAITEGSGIVCFHSEVVDELLKQNFAERQDGRNGWTRGRHFRKIADLSPLAYMAALQKYPEIESMDHILKDRAWRKVLGDPEFMLYRTVQGGI